MKLKEKQKAISLRQRGLSLNEITQKISASKSTISLWVRDIILSPKAKNILNQKLTNGQLAARVARRNLTKQKEQDAMERALKILKGMNFGKDYQKILCALIYYCEGCKAVKEGIVFTNSDPGLVSLFLAIFRHSFELDEKKFRVCVHLHSYHNIETQLNFWSKQAKIPRTQFIKPYLKKHSGSYKKEGYPGCASIRYRDVKIAREMKALALACIEQYK